MAIREKPLPVAPPPDVTVEAYRELLKVTPFPLSRIAEARFGSDNLSDVTETTPPASPLHRRSQAGLVKPGKARIQLDYSSQQLSNMSYSMLAKESFDFAPGENSHPIPADIASRPLEDKLQHLMNLTGSAGAAREGLIASVISSLSLDEFQQCGTWLTQGLGAIVAKQNNLRLRKRTAAQAFENELTERMGLVKKHKADVDQELRRLKEAGSNMVAGKARQVSGTASSKSNGEPTGKVGKASASSNLTRFVGSKAAAKKRMGH